MSDPDPPELELVGLAPVAVGGAVPVGGAVRIPVGRTKLPVALTCHTEPLVSVTATVVSSHSQAAYQGSPQIGRHIDRWMTTRLPPKPGGRARVFDREVSNLPLIATEILDTFEDAIPFVQLVVGMGAGRLCSHKVVTVHNYHVVNNIEGGIRMERAIYAWDNRRSTSPHSACSADSTNSCSRQRVRNLVGRRDRLMLVAQQRR